MPTQIFVDTNDGLGRLMIVDDTETIGDLKIRIADEIGTSLDNQIWQDGFIEKEGFKISKIVLKHVVLCFVFSPFQVQNFQRFMETITNTINSSNLFSEEADARGSEKSMVEVEKVMTYKQKIQMERDNQVCFQIGGAKRKSENSEGYENRNQRIRKLENTFRALAASVAVSAVKCNSVDDMLTAFDTARANLDASPEEAARQTFDKLTMEDISKFVKTVMTSHGLGTRTSMLSHFNSLSEMKETIKLCEAQPQRFVELMLVKNFASNDGSIEWDKVVDFAKKKQTNTTGTGTGAEKEDSDEEMIPAENDDETGGGGGGLKTPKKGRGRPPKANTTT
jgi:hypothetical protein